jgi:HD-GYP domain-containing protein (c-di-GMP phosphodiesterase class II)
MQERIKSLEHKVNQLTALLNASLELNSEIELKLVLQKVLNLMCEVLEAEAGTLWLNNEEDNLICAEVANGPTADKILNIKMKAGEGIVGRVIVNNRSELVEDVTKDPSWAKRVDLESGFITRSLMTIPLPVKNVAIGAMQLVNKRNNRLFNLEDVKTADALANQSAMAIHNSQLFDNMQKFSNSVIRSLTLALDARDPYTAGHSERVGRYAVWIAKKMGLSEGECRELERAALMHDIGKIAVPDNILGKPGGLTNYEFGIMKMHPVNAAKILSKMEPRRQMATAQEVSRYHHEKVNGMGYPDGLKGEEIPLFARIAAVADAFDAITTDRPYKQARTFKEGVDELIRCKGTHFDQVAVDAFTQVMDELNYKINNQERTMIDDARE